MDFRSLLDPLNSEQDSRVIPFYIRSKSPGEANIPPSGGMGWIPVLFDFDGDVVTCFMDLTVELGLMSK